MEAHRYQPGTGDNRGWSRNMNWENRVVEDGYIIDTSTKIRCAADRLRTITNPTEGESTMADIFVGQQTAEELRADNAKTLRAVAASLLLIATELDGPVIDESESDKIGYDADHSVFRR